MLDVPQEKELHDRVYDTKKKHTTNVAKHFNEAHCGDTSLIQIQAIEKMLTPKGDRFGILCRHEVFWIFTPQTRIPNGLNFKWHLTHFYSWMINRINFWVVIFCFLVPFLGWLANKVSFSSNLNMYETFWEDVFFQSPHLCTYIFFCAYIPHNFA